MSYLVDLLQNVAQWCDNSILHKFRSDENNASHCSELSQIHQQPVDAVLCPTFIWKLCYKLPSIVTFTFIRFLIKILSSLLNGAMLTASVMRKFQNSCYLRCLVWTTKSLEKKQTYTKTETYKLYSRVFRIFLPNAIKIDHYNFELYRFN